MYFPLSATGIRRAVDTSVEIINKLGIEDKFDTIVVRGASGILIAGALAVATDKCIAIVRKANDSTHSRGPITSNSIIGKFIVLDDFVDTGATMSAIFSELEQVGHFREDCVAVILYSDESDIFAKRHTIYYDPDRYVPMSKFHDAFSFNINQQAHAYTIERD